MLKVIVGSADSAQNLALHVLIMPSRCTTDGKPSAVKPRMQVAPGEYLVQKEPE